ncbi:tannase/feruloyl esterase family alpha/beta hydrolase [Viridibacterium curvum]|uniref:Tannase/feruloyl esterase family alpha/beta hydrolase n=1 Tax=Viridibacterium curvum TaxID=1101404 RepID=A0ABP9QND1_9RHOO
MHFLRTFLFHALVAIAASSVPLSAASAADNLAVVTARVPCATLLATAIEDIGGSGSRITRASEAADRQGITSCIVEGTLAPSIGFRIALPTRTWTQRYLQIGCGGLCGNIAGMVGAADGCVPLNAGGFVQGATDMGHQGMSGDFGRDAQKRIDFAYRAQHLTAVLARKLIRAYYGQPQAYAYFTGCSDGGREALIAAQRYPEDFDGIIAGAAAMSFTTQNGLYHAWQARSNTGPDGKAILVASRLPLLHKAVLDQCDALDGQKDGLISEPRNCHFDPASIQCAAGQTDTSACLSAQEADAVRKFYAGPIDAETGVKLTLGGPLPGSELNWAGVFVPMSADQSFASTMIAESAMPVLYDNSLPQIAKVADVRFNADTFKRLAGVHALYDATNPDLSRFVQAGRKLILWHGLGDPHISPLTTIAYHEALQQRFGDAALQSFERLYLLPGVAHCSGGEGPSQIDLLTPMLEWVEQGKAPGAIIASQADPAKANSFGQPGSPTGSGPDAGPPRGMNPPPAMAAVSGVKSPVQSRPVFPYPQLPRYSGKGDANQASSQIAGPAQYLGSTPAWIGSNYFTPDSYR